MKTNTHPQYFNDAQVTCACGNSFTTGSTKQHIQVEICAACHPFFTGEMKFIDTAGRVDKFQAKVKSAQQTTYVKKKDKKVAKRIARREALEQAPQTMKEMMAEARKKAPEAQSAKTPDPKQTKTSKPQKTQTETIPSPQSLNDSPSFTSSHAPSDQPTDNQLTDKQ